MAKKKKKEAAYASSAAQEPEGERITRRGWLLVGAGVAALLLGFVVLSFTDPLGQNWASKLAPLLILGAYGVIGAGIMLPESPTASAALQTPEAASTQTNPAAR
ncbi:MAG: hypothetical protein WC969_05285 [Elusimicrobiota bacterium]|jgi:hypothetical protein